MAGADRLRARQQQLMTGMLGGEDIAVATDSAALNTGGATTTFEERTVWNLTDVSFYVRHLVLRSSFSLRVLGSGFS